MDHGGADPSVLDVNYPPPPPTNRWPEAPLVGGLGGGGFSGAGGGFCRGGGGRPGELVGGGVQVGRIGGYMPPRPSIGPSQAPFTSPCPPSNHTPMLIRLNKIPITLSKPQRARGPHGGLLPWLRQRKKEGGSGYLSEREQSPNPHCPCTLQLAHKGQVCMHSIGVLCRRNSI